MLDIVMLEEQQTELRETFVSNLREMDDFQLVSYRRGLIGKFNNPIIFELEGDDRMAHFTGVGLLCIWMEEYLINSDRDLTAANAEFEEMLEEVCNEVFCSECEMRKDLCKCK